jgi:hypothetical protein
MSSTGHVEQALQQGISRLNQGLVFGADQDFLSTLSMGQILKGRVLRHYEGSRYGVEFGGQERVVDSAIALRTGDLIHGRVVGLDDKVHLQKLPAGITRDAGAQDLLPQQGAAASRAIDFVQQLFKDHRAELSGVEHKAIRAVGRQAGNLNLAASAALILRKLGLTLDNSLIRALTRGLSERGQLDKADIEKLATRIAADPTIRVAENHEAVRVLAQSLAQLQVPERAGSDDPAQASPDSLADADQAAADFGGGESRQDQHSALQAAWLLGRRVLNSQGEGSVAHRFVTLPIWLGDQLLEVNLAFFAQTPSDVEEEGVHYRRIVLSLDMDEMGHIEAVVAVANRRLRIAIETENEAASQVLALWMGNLKSDLAAFGWEVDEMTYGTRFADQLNLPAQSVVSHYVRQDSLSRLM